MLPKGLACQKAHFPRTSSSGLPAFKTPSAAVLWSFLLSQATQDVRPRCSPARAVWTVGGHVQAGRGLATLSTVLPARRELPNPHYY